MKETFAHFCTRQFNETIDQMSVKEQFDLFLDLWVKARAEGLKELYKELIE